MDTSHSRMLTLDSPRSRSLLDMLTMCGSCFVGWSNMCSWRIRTLPMPACRIVRANLCCQGMPILTTLDLRWFSPIQYSPMTGSMWSLATQVGPHTPRLFTHSNGAGFRRPCSRSHVDGEIFAICHQGSFCISSPAALLSGYKILLMPLLRLQLTPPHIPCRAWSTSS